MGKLIVVVTRSLSLCAVLLALPAAAAAAQETLIAPFVNGPDGATTTNSYSGSVSIDVSGSGQAAGTAYSDAFYVFTDGSGNPITPEHHFDFGLCITIPSNGFGGASWRVLAPNKYPPVPATRAIRRTATRSTNGFGNLKELGRCCWIGCD